MKRRAIIIGAGYGGMALANLLGKAGWCVDVYEKNAEVGGRLYTYKDSGFTFDLGPSWYLMPEVFDHYYQLFNESATSRLELIRLSPGYKVFFDYTAPIIIQGDVNQDAAIFEEIEPGAGKQLRQYVKRSSTVYRLAIKEFLYDNYDSVFSMLSLRLFTYPLKFVALAAQSLDRYVSRFFQDRRLKQLLEYHMVFLGNSPFEAPAIYSLMSHLDFMSGVFYPKKGMAVLASDMQQLGNAYDITYHTNSPVEKILVKNHMAYGILLENGEQILADTVISNADLHFTETQLLAPDEQTYPEAYWRQRQSGPGALLISLGVSGALPQLQHHNLYFVDEWQENFAAIYEHKKIPAKASLYICNPTKTDASLTPPFHENLFILVPLPAGVALSVSEQERLSNNILHTIAKVIDCPDLLERITLKRVFGPEDFGGRYNAWAYNAFGGESHLLRQSVGFRTANKSRKVEGLYYVGAGTQPGIGLPMCLISAEILYKRLVGDSRHGPLKDGLS